MSGMLSQVEQRLKKFETDIATGRRKKGELQSETKKVLIGRSPQGSVARPLPRRELRPPASFDIEGEGAEYMEPEPKMFSTKGGRKTTRRPSMSDPSGAKTVGVKVSPDAYAALQRLREARKLKSIKEAVLAVLADWMNRGAPVE